MALSNHCIAHCKTMTYTLDLPERVRLNEWGNEWIRNCSKPYQARLNSIATPKAKKMPKTEFFLIAALMMRTRKPLNLGNLAGQTRENEALP